jgi:hypothetical protein
MNIKQAKSIPLISVLEKLGFQPQRKRRDQYWYLSPVRNEKTASFHLHAEKGLWYDFGTGKGGNVLDFAIAWLESRGKAATVSDALKWLTDYGFEPLPANLNVLNTKPERSAYSLLRKTEIQHPALIQYLKSRGIPLEIAQTYLEQAHVGNKETGNVFFSLCMENEEGGFELRNPYLKGCIAPKFGTFIRGSVVKPPGLHIFEGMMDFLSVFTREKGRPLENDSYILHSTSMIHTAPPFIKEYGYQKLFTWLHNDKAGEAASLALQEFVKTQDGLTHYPMNNIYAPHKDVNAWHMDQLCLPPLPGKPRPG